MKWHDEMTEDPNSAVMREIMCVQINTYFDTIFKNPWFLNGAPTFWNSGGVQGLSEPLLLNPTANPAPPFYNTLYRLRNKLQATDC